MNAPVEARTQRLQFLFIFFFFYPTQISLDLFFSILS